MVYSNKKVKFNLCFILALIILITGCSGLSQETISSIEVPAYSSIDEYITWGAKNDVKIRLIDSEEEVVDRVDYGKMLQITSEIILSGETLDIIVCRKDANCTLIIENNPMENFKKY